MTFRGGGSGSSGSSLIATTGAEIAFRELVSFEESLFTQTGGTWKGTINIHSTAAVSSEGVSAAGATVNVSGGTWTLPSGTTTVAGFAMEANGKLLGAGGLSVTGTFEWLNGRMAGSGTTTVQSSVSGTIALPAGVVLERPLVNEGQLTMTSGELDMGDGAYLTNKGTFIDNYEVSFGIGSAETGRQQFTNLGVFRRTSLGPELPGVEVPFLNEGLIEGAFRFRHLIEGGRHGWGCTVGDPSFPKRELAEEEGVCAASGDLSETQTDFSVGGRGVGLILARTYNSQAAAAGAKGVFGYGWSSPYSQHLVLPAASGVVTLVQENGSTVEFIEGMSGEFTAPAGSPDVLHGTAMAGYTLTLENQTVDRFSGSSGRLESITDRNGNATSLGYSEAGLLKTVTDPASRKLTFTYNVEGLVEKVEDPMGHAVKYVYEGGNLASVTQPGEVALRWQFKYEGSHRLVELTDGRGGKTAYEYKENRVVSKTDPMKRVTSFEYATSFLKSTNVATGAVTVQYFTSSGQLAKVVHGFGTVLASSESFTYDEAGNQITADRWRRRHHQIRVRQPWQPHEHDRP